MSPCRGYYGNNNWLRLGRWIIVTDLDSVFFLALQSREPYPLLWVLHSIKHERCRRAWRFRRIDLNWPGVSGKPTNTCFFGHESYCFISWLISSIFVHHRLCPHCIVACQNASRHEPKDLLGNHYIDRPSMVLTHQGKSQQISTEIIILIYLAWY